METGQIADESITVCHQHFFLTEVVTGAVYKKTPGLISIDP